MDEAAAIGMEPGTAGWMTGPAGNISFTCSYVYTVEIEYFTRTYLKIAWLEREKV